MFATDAGLHHFASLNKWFMDGTFNSAALLFSQLYVIHAPLADLSVSCVYTFLTKQDQSMYENLLVSVQYKCSELSFQTDPTTVTTDYELGALNTISTTFRPQVDIHGCFYHLTQNTWRKVQSLGLVECYHEEDDVKLFCVMLDGLVFLPVDDVLDGLADLKENITEGLELRV